jgi:hypothetical protein
VVIQSPGTEIQARGRFWRWPATRRVELSARATDCKPQRLQDRPPLVRPRHETRTAQRRIESGCSDKEEKRKVFPVWA